MCKVVVRKVAVEVLEVWTQRTVMMVAWKSAKTAAKVHGGKAQEYIGACMKLAAQGLEVVECKRIDWTLVAASVAALAPTLAIAGSLLAKLV